MNVYDPNDPEDRAEETSIEFLAAIVLGLAAFGALELLHLIVQAVSKVVS